MGCECGGHQFGSQPAIWSVSVVVISLGPSPAIWIVSVVAISLGPSVSVVVISLLPSPAIWTGMRKFWIHQDFLIEHWHMLCIMSM